MCSICQLENGGLGLYDFHVVPLDGGSVTADLDPGKGAVGAPAFDLPEYSVSQIAQYLTRGFWEDLGKTPRAFALSGDKTITVNLEGLDSKGQVSAWKALDAWSSVSGLTFTEAETAMIVFTDHPNGASTSSRVEDGEITRSAVNVEGRWQAYPDYYQQIFMHEIGHALGLGHAGNYNYDINFARDAHYANDSWQMSIMSYFDQKHSGHVDASPMFLATPQLADIAAIQMLYGAPQDIRDGNSLYGDGAASGGAALDLPGNRAVTLVDTGGTDLINLAGRSIGQVLDLRAEHFSDINGKIGNLAIARGTQIENARTGSGADRITGNAASNQIAAGAGRDTLDGQAGNDVLDGGAGRDLMTGGAGADRFVYRSLSDAGDRITDFSTRQGDLIDLSGLLASLGWADDSNEAPDALRLVNGKGGADLVIDAAASGAGGQTVIATLVGVNAADTTVSEITGLQSAQPRAPITWQPQAQAYVFSDWMIEDWQPERGSIPDTHAGVDTLDFEALSYRVKMDLKAGAGGVLGGGDIVISHGNTIENLFLGKHNDLGVGDDDRNEITGGAGNDRILGREGDDLLDGGDGRDSIVGGQGADTILGGDGNDFLRGGQHSDDLQGSAGADRLFGNAGDDILQAGTGSDLLFGGTGDDILRGGADDDRLVGQGGDDTLSGEAGDDLLRGGTGNDTLDGGQGNDRLWGNGNQDLLIGDGGSDRLHGGAGADTLDGGAGNDVLLGGAGSDVLDGGAGDDVLHGGGLDGARDIFVFGTGYGRDRINGFDQAGNDLVDLQATLWMSDDAVQLTSQEVIDTYGSLNPNGTILTLDFGNGDVLEVQSAAGIDMASFGADIFIG